MVPDVVSSLNGLRLYDWVVRAWPVRPKNQILGIICSVSMMLAHLFVLRTLLKRKRFLHTWLHVRCLRWVQGLRGECLRAVALPTLCLPNSVRRLLGLELKLRESYTPSRDWSLQVTCCVYVEDFAIAAHKKCGFALVTCFFAFGCSFFAASCSLIRLA